jgi:SAM-dependent methyltransferase
MIDRVDLFHCLRCGASRLQEAEDALICPSCAHRYPVVRGIPRFVEELPFRMAQVQSAFDFEHRHYQDSSYTRFSPHLVDQFLEDCRIPSEFFRGIRVLDAGCGSGRWTYAMAELEAKVVAFDLTAGGLEVMQEQFQGCSNVILCQADLYNLPFPSNFFDFVMSWGVLHHTPDTRNSFSRLVPLVKPGGFLYIMVYERCRPVMFFFTNILRWFMRRLPNERRYALCRHLIVRNRFIGSFLGHFLMISYYDKQRSPLDLKTLQFGLYDAYSPRYNHLHTREEVTHWFRDSGFTDITIVDSPTGAVKVRGRKADS